jgi:SAM-dependent methyltransferase
MTLKSYTGLSAASYDLWFGDEGFEDVDFFRDAIRDGGEPALEVACGTGRLLIPFAREGLDVQGLDLSAEMLGICRWKAEAEGMQLTLHRAAMEEFALDSRFRTIFVPFGKARRALSCFRAHLEEGGRVLIPLHLPWLHDVGVEPAPPGEWRLRRVATRPEDDAVVRCFENTTFDFDRQVQDVKLRFEVVLGGEVIEHETSEQRLLWYTQEQFAGLLDEAGFSDVAVLEGYTWEPAATSSASFMVVGS